MRAWPAAPPHPSTDAARPRRPPAHPGRLLRRPDDPPRRGADLLRADVAVPGGAARRLAARAHRRVPAHVGGDRQLPARGGPARGARAARRLAPWRVPAQGVGRDGADRLDPRRALRHDGRARGGAPGAQRRVRGRERALVPPAQGDRHRLHRRLHDPHPRHIRTGLRGRLVRQRHVRPHRARERRGDGLGDRPLAGCGAGGDARLRAHLLRHAGRRAARVPLGHTGGRRRRAAVARGVARLLGLRLLRGRRRRGVWRLRRRHRARRLALAHQRRPALRRRAERGDRAREGAPRGRRARGHARPARPWGMMRAMDLPAGLTEGYADLREVRLHYVEAGEGPLVVLLHGFPEFWYGWRHQIPALAERGFRVVAPDMRGYNRSSKPRGVAAYDVERLSGDIRELVRERGEERCFLAGHDWGAAVAYGTAGYHPDAVEKLAILNVPHPRRLLEGWRKHPKQLAKSWYMFFFQVPGLPERLASARSFTGFQKSLDTAKLGAFTDEDRARYREAWAQPHAATAMINYYRAALRQAPWKVTQRLK